MKAQIDWQSLIAPPDFSSIYRLPCVLRRWLHCARTPTGLSFQCQVDGLGDGQGLKEIPVRIDVIFPDVLRLRMNPHEIRQRRSDMLVQQEWTAPAFEVIEKETGISLQTECIRAEFPRFPWRMQVFSTEALPFFRQQTEDHCYGPAYEVPPVGYERSADGRTSVRECVSVTPGEAFYGFGEKFTPLNKWGQELNSWSVDSGNVSSFRSYKNIPFFMSSAGYGLFVHSSYPMVFRLGSESSISYSIHILDEELDYFLIYGPSYRQILKRYRDLTGKAPVPPKWSFGFWISRCGYKNRAEVEEVVHGMRQGDFPCDTPAAAFDLTACRWSIESYKRVVLASPSKTSPLGIVVQGRMLSIYLPNTVLYATSSALIVVLLSGMSGYAFSRYRFWGHDYLMTGILAVTGVPLLTNLLRLYQMGISIRNLPMPIYDDRVFIIIVYTGFFLPLSVWIAKGFFDAIPRELEEAALIDGCSAVRALLQITLPLAMPGMTAVFLLTFVSVWNEFIAGYLLITKNDLKPAMFGMYDFLGQNIINAPLIAAACIIIALPMVVVFLVARQSFFRAMVEGAIKG